MVELPKKFNVSSYSAFCKNEDGSFSHFHGIILTETKQEIKFKFKCPFCKAEGSELEHKNWYESKEAGDDLIIRCNACMAELNIDSQDSDEIRKWVCIL